MENFLALRREALELEHLADDLPLMELPPRSGFETAKAEHDRDVEAEFAHTSMGDPGIANEIDKMVEEF